LWREAEKRASKTQTVTPFKTYAKAENQFLLLETLYIIFQDPVFWSFVGEG
jgi:hypothetical protein